MLCKLCPRKCNIDRVSKVGVCGVEEKPKVAKAYLHMWEEPCITGKNGSGTVFFSGCNLKCDYCQNYKISSEGFGKYITVEELAGIFKKLEGMGATNINLVSPSHYVVAIKQALDVYRPNIPIVYNSNGYDSLEALEMLKDYIYYMHIKDANKKNIVVPAGEGEGNIRYIANEYIKRGGKVFTMEPHLAVFEGFAALEKQGESIDTSQFTYDSADTAFNTACDAFKKLI